MERHISNDKDQAIDFERSLADLEPEAKRAAEVAAVIARAAVPQKEDVSYSPIYSANFDDAREGDAGAHRRSMLNADSFT